MFRYRFIFLFIGACFVAIFLILSGLVRPLGDLTRRATLPLLHLLAGTASQLSTTQDHPAPLSMNEVLDLERRLRALAIDYSHLRALEEENKDLRAQAKFLTTSGYDSVGARVISRELDNGRALLLVDRGLHDGVEVGQAVVTREGIFIGQVLSLKDQIATIQLLSDPQSRVAAAAAGGTRLLGVIEGKGNGAAQLNYIASSEVVARDQIIVTAGAEDKVPKNIPLGIINAVFGKSTDPFLTAVIEPLVPMNALVFVSILRPSVLKPVS